MPERIQMIVRGVTLGLDDVRGIAARARPGGASAAEPRFLNHHGNGNFLQAKVDKDDRLSRRFIEQTGARPMPRPAACRQYLEDVNRFLNTLSAAVQFTAGQPGAGTLEDVAAKVMDGVESLLYNCLLQQHSNNQFLQSKVEREDRRQFLEQIGENPGRTGGAVPGVATPPERCNTGDEALLRTG
ncbi:hypothetical protein PT974_01247 [Cladobotryum mycophilum]|uniref:Uncharacterized protein n=1 Tax=Cladobotryum mycophilum TaxID=491253 RepID=A0ABR0T347_9HYPO